MQKNTTKLFLNAGMDMNSAPDLISPEDMIAAFNIRNTGTALGEAGYITNIESTAVVTETTSPHAGINKGIGAREFDGIEKAVMFRYNSFGYHQILVYDYSTNSYRAVYTDITDSAGNRLMPLDPRFYVTAILLVNDDYLVWTDGQSSIGFTNISKLISGAYGTITAEDFSLIKPQPLPPITGYYTNDAGKASNFLKGKLFQFNAMWFGQDYTSSAWSTWSKRIIPTQEATPSIGDDVSQNNCIVISVPIGSSRVQTINIGARYGDFDFNIIKSVDRSYAVALTSTTIDIATEVFEAYDPATGLYSFVFYNDSVAIPVAPTETDLPYDSVPLTAGAGEILNGDIIALGDVTEGYPRPQTAVNIAALGYDPNITIPNTDVDEETFAITYIFPGASGSGEGNHKRKMAVALYGVPHTGDQVVFVLADIRDATQTITYAYTVPSSEDGNLYAVVISFSITIPSSNQIFNSDGSITITFVGPPYYGLQRAYILLVVPGATVSKSIHGVLDNSSYQLALSYRDAYGRYFPLRTDNNFIVKTPSFAQTQGLAVKINWQINAPTAPVDAVDYQWLITKNNTVATLLDVLASPVDFISGWDAHNNTPTLIINPGNVGHAYQVTTPNFPSDTINLGNGVKEYHTGDYVISNGKSWDVVPKEFADFTNPDSVWTLKLNPLDLFNTDYANNGKDTVLSYDYTPNDRCTLHFYYDGSTKMWLNNPCVDVTVLGYDPSTFLLKISKPSTLDLADLVGKNIYIRVYSPKQSVSRDTVFSNETVWYEIGERFTITNGNHDTLNGSITDGDVYFKTRQYRGGVDPNNTYPYLATDFNFSDFYASAYTSYGRPRTFLDTLERTERRAIIRYSQNYILGSRNNGLTRFFQEAIYGEADGQTSSSWGAIGALWQRGNTLVIAQETNIGYAGINLSILEDMEQQKQYAISEKLINNIRYNQSGDIGIGRAKESFCFDDNIGWFVDPNKSAVYQIALDGLTDITFKMSKYFKDVIQQQYRSGKKLVMYYDKYYREVVFCTETEDGVLTEFSFDALSWKTLENYTVAPGAITPANGSHSTVAYNSGTGIATYTPIGAYTGNDVSVISFSVDGVPQTKNVCLNWTPGVSVIQPISFAPLTGQPLSTLLYSNTQLISGNTIPAPISISTGGEYSVNGGSFTSASGTVNSGDVVQARQTSSASYMTETIVTLSVGGQSAPFSITTLSDTGLSTLYVANNLGPISTFQVTVDNHDGGPNDTAFASVGFGGTNTQDINPLGDYTVRIVYFSPHGNPTAPCIVNGNLFTMTNGIPIDVLMQTAPIVATLNIIE